MAAETRGAARIRTIFTFDDEESCAARVIG